MLRGAHDGELPLFARTLGLPQCALAQMMDCCFPRREADDHPIPERKYAALMDSVPQRFRQMLALLSAARTPGADPLHADWLARAFAAASLGGRFLWQDMGLSGRDDVGGLLQQFFEPLHRRNTGGLKWKQFLVGEAVVDRQGLIDVLA